MNEQQKTPKEQLIENLRVATLPIIDLALAAGGPKAFEKSMTSSIENIDKMLKYVRLAAHIKEEHPELVADMEFMEDNIPAEEHRKMEEELLGFRKALEEADKPKDESPPPGNPA